MKQAEGKALRLGAFALALAAAFPVSMAYAQDAAPQGAPPEGVPADAPPAPPVDATPAPADMPISDSGSGGGGGGDAGGTEGGGFFGGMSASFSGFLRYEGALSTGRENIYNLRGNPFNGVAQERHAFPANAAPILSQLGPLGDNVTQALGLATVNTVATRNTPPSDNDWNLQQLRGKFDMNATLGSNLQLFASLRTIYDFGRYDNWDPNDTPNPAQCPLCIGADANPTNHAAPNGFNYQKPEFFRYGRYNGKGTLSYFEVAGQRYMADFPALYLDYTAGPVLIRFGIQQIAWGQALFFRIFDTPDGLDLRRHLILDDALEEYADERRSSPGLRVTWQVSNEWEADSYVQLFEPTEYPLPNTPYNVIPAQFTVHDSFWREHKWDVNYGLRLRANFGNWGMQFIATQRYNQEGTFRWIASGVQRDLPGVPGSGLLVAGTPLEVDPSGVWSANEWFTYAGAVRLNGVEGLNTLVREYQPFTGLLSGSEVGDSKQAAARELDEFFMVAGGAALGNLSGGGLRGHIQRDYDKETIVGAGGSYVVEAEPGSLLDQLIINVETSYIPNRKFTEQGLSYNYPTKDESVSDLVMEKYHRWFDEFPATYMVFQAIHKTQSDLFGRLLDCQGGTGGNPGTAAADVNTATKECHNVKGGHTDVVIAALQPFPNYIYRLSGAALLDVRGGLFAQVGFRWSPNGSITIDTFYNYLKGNLYGKDNENIIQTIDSFDELCVRIAYQF